MLANLIQFFFGETLVRGIYSGEVCIVNNL